MVDTALMGRQDSPIYLGAVALGSILFNFIYWGMGFLRMGTTGLTAQAFGKGDTRAQMTLLVQAVGVGIACALFFICVQVPMVQVGFKLIPGEADVIALAKEYFYIRIWAAPATISLYALIGWSLGMQEARIPMILTVVGNALNISLNLYMVNGLGMKADGVALATVIAQYASLLLAIGLLAYKYRPLLKSLEWGNVWEVEGLRRFFSVNGDIFIRTVSLIFAFSFFTARSSGFDPLILAANQILLQYLTTMAFGVDGFAFAAESLVGRYTGAKDQENLRLAIRMLFRWGLGLGAVFSVVYMLAGEVLLDVFTNQEEVIQTALPYLPWLYILPFTGAYAYMWDGVYFGATATRPMRNAMLIATFAVFLPIALLANLYGNHMLWLAMFVYMLGRGASLHLLAKRFIWQ